MRTSTVVDSNSLQNCLSKSYLDDWGSIKDQDAENQLVDSGETNVDWSLPTTNRTLETSTINLEPQSIVLHSTAVQNINAS